MPVEIPPSGESPPLPENPVKPESHENQGATNSNQTKKKPGRAPREGRARGPPANGIPSKTKVMVANLPYDLTEEKVKKDTPTPLSSTNITPAQRTFC